MDRLIFFLIPLLLLGVSFADHAFAQIEKTQFGDNQFLSVNEDGSYKYKFTSKPERISINDSWVDFRFINGSDFLSVETGHGSVKLDKNFCNFEFYKKGTIQGAPLFSDSIVAKMANNGSNNWTEINSITNANCETYGNENQLVAKKYVSNVGYIEYKFINTGSSWKTQLEATNLSSNTNKKFGFSQTIELNRDIIKFGNTQINLDNYDNSTFDRSWIVDHDSKVINLLNNFSFDIDLAFDHLDSIFVLDTGTNKTKLTFNYLHNQTVILPGQTLIEDPTFNDVASSNGRVYSSGSGSDCSALTGTNADASGDVMKKNVATECQMQWAEFNISSIPSTSTVSSAYFEWDQTGTVSMIEDCGLYAYSTQPSTLSTAAKWSQGWAGVGSGTSSLCQSDGTNKQLTLNSTGISNLQANISGNEGWWGAMFQMISPNADGTRKTFVMTAGETRLNIVYTTTNPPYAVTDLATTSIGQNQICYSWSAPYAGGGGQTIIGYQFNLTTPWTSNPLVFVNDTGSTSTTYCATSLTFSTQYTARVSAWTNNTSGHPFNNATGNKVNATTTAFNPPGAPTLGASALSDTALRLTSVAGTAGDNSTIWYGVRCSLNGAAFSDTVSNSSLVTRIYEVTGLTLGDELICQWRDGSVDGWSDWSGNATDELSLSVLSTQRTDDRNDPLLKFINFVDEMGGVWFGLGLIPFAVMLVGFMAGKKTVRIFTLITLSLMGIIHGSGYYVYPDWYWTLSILFGIGLVLGRQKSD